MSHITSTSTIVMSVKFHGILLLQSMLTCISCSAFVTEMLELHWWNTTDHREHNPIDVFAMVHCSVRKTGTIVPTACANHGPHSMENEEEVLDAIHANPMASAHWVTYKTGLPQWSLA